MPLPIAGAIFWIAVALCTVAELFIIRSAFVKRASVRRGPEIVWVILPAIGLALVLAATWRVMHAMPATPAPAGTSVSTRGTQS